MDADDAAELTWHRHWMEQLSDEPVGFDRRHESAYETAILCIRRCKAIDSNEPEGSTRMTERQAAVWPECVARLNRAVEWNAVPEDIREWSVKWDEETRPGRGRGLNATFIDGEVFAQIILDVYGYGSESVAELNWVHASGDEECRCDVCKADA